MILWLENGIVLIAKHILINYLVEIVLVVGAVGLYDVNKGGMCMVYGVYGKNAKGYWCKCSWNGFELINEEGISWFRLMTVRWQTRWDVSWLKV